MTATPILILWVALNVIGAIIMGWLSFIAWERRIAMIIRTDAKIFIQRKRLERVNNQLVYRVAGFILFNVLMILGLLPMFGIVVPADGTAWILVLTVLVIVCIALKELLGEFKS